MSATIVCAIAIAVTSAFERVRLGRCTSCRPRCPNDHENAKSGMEGMFCAAVVLLVVMLLETGGAFR